MELPRIAGLNDQRVRLVRNRDREITIRDMAYLDRIRFPREKPGNPLPAGI